MPPASAMPLAFGAGIGYALYYLSFVTAAIALYFIRTRGGYRSIPEFLASKYGTAVLAAVFDRDRHSLD
jgi:SSS family solute:Na+ symporter